MAQKQGLSPKLIEEVTRVAIQTVLDFQEKEKQKQQKAKRDWRLRNTKLLLKHYRSFVKHSEGVKERLSVAEGSEAIEDFYTNELAIESIKKSKQRTLAMVQFIQRMLEVYKAMCETSGQPEEMRRYQIIESLYISEEKLTVDELAECHKIDTRTVYRDVNEAVKTLSVLVFGVDGVEMTG
ncbi:HTH domain-containing protein [Brevibacillus agri]|uniref:HTH domain-containing protein n=1 Tax=Brevibacillus agri TaxID=51101 RepID=UPI002E228C02|nr:HTH domain-containing protein [Brevibacillus agri]MED1652589.1 HTH domain-containing protein [Brevibacillus agri]MED1689657.1 HTH domain-containing protein [Brevibacillus agri]MED1691105.1 HTH domain-containing protein [Brevibacillus agri]MED1696785.1 HTH domain-containing protein [Brevibacillus agri]